MGFFLALFGHTVIVTQALAPQLEPRAHVYFAGDMMFDRTVRTTIDQKGGDFVFSCIDGTLSQADLVVANLEGPITATSSQSVDSAIGSRENFVFTFPPSTAPLLEAHHIGIINIGNNHIENFGNAGVRATEQYLTAAGVQYFGDPIAGTVATTSVRGVALAFVNYNQFARGGEASTTLFEIQAAKVAGELPIVFAHWGVEYAATSTPLQQELAHEFIDAGAAFVVGSHPHTVEEHEMYRGIPIYYSLGNFIFDQYWNDTVDHGLMLDVAFTKEGVASLREIPVVLQHDRRTCLQE